MTAKTAIRIARVIFRVALAFVAVAAIVLTAASTQWFRNYLQGRVTSALEQATGGRVEIAGFHFRPLRLGVDITRLTVHGREAAGEPPLFEARNIETRVSPRALIHFRVELRQFRWAQARVSVRTLADGGTNIPGPQGSSGLQQTVSDLLSFSARRVQLNHTDIDLNSKHFPVAVSANNLTLILRALPGRRYSGDVSASPLNLHGDFGRIPAVSLASHFTLDRTSLNVVSFRWNTKMLAGTAAAAVEWSPALSAHFNFAAEGDIAQLAREAHLNGVEGGGIELHGRGSYADAAWKLDGGFEARQLDLRGGGLRDVKLDFSGDYSANQEKILLSNLRAGLFGGGAKGSGEVLLGGKAPEFKIRGTLQGLEAGSLLSDLAGNHSTLQLLKPAALAGGKFDATWQGAVKNFHSNFDLALKAPASVPQGAIPIAGTVSGSADYRRAFSLAIKNANLQTPHSTIQAQGGLGAGNMGLHVDFTTTDVNLWSPVIEFYTASSSPLNVVLEQPAHFLGMIMGTVTQPVVVGRFSTGGFTFQGWKWDSFETVVKLAPDGASLSSARLRHGSSILQVDAAATLDHWKFEPSSTVHLALRANGSPVEALRAALGIKTPVAGLLTGELSLDGTRDNLSGQGKAEIVQGRAGSESFDSAAARLNVAHSAWTFEDVVIQKGKAKVTGTAAVDFEQRSYTAAFHGEHIEIADILAAGKKGTGANPPFRGTAQFTLQSEGTFDRPQGGLQANLTGLRVRGTSVGKGQLQLKLRGTSLEGTVEASGPNGKIKFSGSGQAAGEWPVNVTGNFSDFRLDPWIEALSQNQSEPPIIAGGSFQLAGPLKNPARLEGHGEVQSLEVQFPNLSFHNQSPAQIAYSGGSVRIGALHMKGPATDFEASGSINPGGSSPLSLDVTGQADATLLRLLDSQIEASGRSDLKVKIGGDFASPRLQGSLTVRDVSVGYASLPFRVTGLNGVFELQGDKAVISQMTGTVGGGKVSLSGSVSLGQLPRYDIAIVLQQVRVRYPSDFTSVLDGHLALRGTSERGMLGGDVAVRNVFVSQNFNLFNLAGAATGPGVNPAVASPIASQIEMNVRVTSSPAVQLETRNVRLVADVDLRIGGSLAEPVVLGAIRARSGNAIFRGNRYSITRGEIEFNNPFETQPSLDLEAQTRVQSYDLSVQVEGPFDRLRFSYRSDPPLATEDILSLLALGYAQRNQGVGTTNSRSVSSSVGASALLSEALSSQVSGRIQELFGVSRISIDPNLDEPGAGSGPRVTVEQQLSPELTLTYSTSTANSQYRVIQFEWDVSQDVSVIGTRDYNGIFGLEVRFRKRFK